MFQKKKRVSKKKITKRKLEKTWTKKGLQTAEPRKTSSHSKETGNRQNQLRNRSSRKPGLLQSEDPPAMQPDETAAKEMRS